MGLDFNACMAHWSYSGFNRFRERLAAAEGRSLDSYFEMDERATPLSPLLNHSDCDGDISPEDCATVAKALREIVMRWPEDDYDRQHGLLLAEGMEYCAKNNEPLEFC